MSQFVKADKGKLSNGIAVSHLHLPKALKFNIVLEVPIGAIHDPVGKEGLSHILEHSVFCGTENLSEEQIDQITAQLGGGKNASTGGDTTTFDVWASAHDPDHYKIIADLMRELVGSPAFPRDRIETEMKVILNEEADGVDDLRRGPMMKTSENIFSGNGRFPNIIGTPDTIQSVTADDLADFIKENYNAAHMHIYSAGPIKFDSVMDVLEQTLSALPAQNKPHPDRFKFFSRNAEERSVRGDLRQNYITLFFAKPPPETLKEVLTERLADDALRENIAMVLRRRHGCFYSPQMGNWLNSDGEETKVLSLSARPEDSLLAVESAVALIDELDELMSDDLLTGRIKAKGFDYKNPDTLTINETGDMALFKQFYGGEYDTREIVEAYQQIEPEDVRKIAREVLQGLRGLYVQGPEPDRIPSLDHLQEILRSHAPEDRGLKQSFGGKTPAFDT